MQVAVDVGRLQDQPMDMNPLSLALGAGPFACHALNRSRRQLNVVRKEIIVMRLQARKLCKGNALHQLRSVDRGGSCEVHFVLWIILCFGIVFMGSLSQHQWIYITLLYSTHPTSDMRRKVRSKDSYNARI